MKIYKLIFVSVLMTVFIFGFISCDTKSSNANDSIWPPIGYRVFYQIWRNANDSFFAYGEIMETDSETFPGETYTKIQLGNFGDQGNEGLFAWLDLGTPGQIGFKGAEMYWNFGVGKSSGVLDGEWDMREIFDTPLYFPYTGEVGETYTDEGTVSYYFGGDETDVDQGNMHIAVTYTSSAASITVPMGTYNDAHQLDVVFTETITSSSRNRLLKSESFTGQYFIHTTLGVLSAFPVPGFYMAQMASDED